jgi:hypothetical protein
MKSNSALIGIVLLFLVLATASSVTLWEDISSPVKIGMFAFGFGAGVAAGTWIARRRNSAS